MIHRMNEGGEAVTDQAPVSLTKTPKKGWRRIPVWAAVGAAVTVAAGVTLWVWAPWVDRSPFTAYTVGVQDEEHTGPGSTPDSCIRTAASEEETVIYDEDGKRLASGRAEREGERLGPEFGEWAGDCLIVTRIDGVPGGFGTYLTEWGGGSRNEISEEELRLSSDQQRERFKTMDKPE
ncbi:hypothetical protein ACWC10_17850 [Streptomyces sp. NPDC001595]|uniref:hypothetical protein n=1 Tax=Streptomyces sp. NPDC001532 TaxID=3154520 RepID=UPI00332B78D6